MLTLSSIGGEIATRRKNLGLTQTELAKRASVGRSTLDALENTRIGELGFAKIVRIISALGMELKLQEERSPRPTLDELREENRLDELAGKR